MTDSPAGGVAVAGGSTGAAADMSSADVVLVVDVCGGIVPLGGIVPGALPCVVTVVDVGGELGVVTVVVVVPLGDRVTDGELGGGWFDGLSAKDTPARVVVASMVALTIKSLWDLIDVLLEGGGVRRAPHHTCKQRMCRRPGHALRKLEVVVRETPEPPDSRDEDRGRVGSVQPALVNAAYLPRTRRWALLVVVVASFAAAAWVARPLWVAILLGVVMAVSVHHPYEALLRRLGDSRRMWAAAAMTLLSGLLLTLAGVLVLVTLTNELMMLVSRLDEHQSSGSLGGLIGERGARAIENLGIDTARVYAWARREIGAAASYIATLAALVVRTTSYAMLALVVALTTMYYVLLEGPGLAGRIERLAPLDPRHTRALIQEAREVGRDAFLGTLATAVIQGVLAGIGYAALGVPQPVAWAVATTLASFLPVIGTLIVWVPLCGYLLAFGHPVRAVLLAAWGILVVTSLADYVIRPRIVGARGHGHPLLTLIALLGGIEVFGLAGLVISPIVMSVFVAAFRIYEREVRTGGLHAAVPPPPAVS